MNLEKYFDDSRKLSSKKEMKVLIMFRPLERNIELKPQSR